MRRARSTFIALAASAVVLTGCSGGGTSPTTSPTPTADGATDDAAATADRDTDTTTQAPDDAATTGDAAGQTEDVSAATGAPGSEVEGGAEGAAAATVAKKFFTAMVSADPEACDYLLSFTDVEVPMIEVTSDYETCQTLLPPILEEEVKAQGLDEEGTAILEAMTIAGADVHSDGKTAVIDKDNFSPLFAESMGKEIITLKKLDDTWYIDLDHSFTPSGQ